MPDVRGLIQDPRFQAFPLEERLAALRKINADPEFISRYASMRGGQGGPSVPEPAPVEQKSGAQRTAEAIWETLKGGVKEAPLVAMRAARMPQDIVRGGIELGADVTGLSQNPAIARALMQGAEQDYRLRRAVEKPLEQKPGATPAEKVGRFGARAAPTVALAAMTGGASLPMQAAALGGAAGAQTASEGGTPGEVAASTTFGAAGTLAGPGAGKILGKVAGPLKQHAINLYSKALHPTKEATKTIAKKIVPELVERQVTGSLRKIGDLADEQIEALGQQIGNAYRTATRQGVKVSGDKLADALESLKVPFTAPGKSGDIVALNPRAIASIDELQTTLRALGDTTPEVIHSYRRVIDDIVSQSNGFTRELSRGSAKQIQKQARQAFQDALNKGVGGIEDLNREFSFWKGVQQVVRETSRRSTGQQGGLLRTVVQPMLIGSSFGVGMTASPPAGAAILLGTILAPAVRSPAWRTVSASHKAALADILAGNAKALQSEVGREVAAALAQLGVRVSVVPEALSTEEERRIGANVRR